MGDQNKQTPGPKAMGKGTDNDSGLIRFISRHRPTLSVGNYRIALSQQITIRGSKQESLKTPDQYIAFQ